MRNLILFSMLAGCSSGSLLVLTVDADAPLAVSRLHVAVSQGSRTRALDVPLAQKSIPPAHTFGVTFESRGKVTVDIEAFDDADHLVASATGERDVGGGRSDLMLRFVVEAPPDLATGEDLARADLGGADLGGEDLRGEDGGVTPCGPGTHSCAGVCVPRNDVATCGDSCDPCPVPLHGAASCDGTSCGLQCDSGYHACGDSCVSDLDPASCGVSCSPCAAPGGGSATCDGTQCGGSCPGGQKLCAGTCILNASSCNGTCPSGSHDCGGLCATDSSTNSCGSSCVPCPLPANAATATCDGTSCGFTCKSGYHKCGGACLSDSDAGSCGSSCTPCPIGPSNSTAICTPGGCDWQCNLNFKKCGAACIPSTNCCGDVDCAGGSNVNAASCVSGACQITMCSAGFVDCDNTFAGGCERNIQTSDGQTGGGITHCGSCNGTCPLPANATNDDCVTGACHVTSCAAGRADCDATFANGCEKNTATSDGQTGAAIDHCGACGTPCPIPAQATNSQCASGACVATCNAGRGDCDGNFGNGCEANVTTSDGQTGAAINHCGACGTTCPNTSHVTGTSCVASGCHITTCAAGFADCDGVYSNGCEVNTNTDNAFCGSCFNTCGANAFCATGTCTTFKRVFVTSGTYDGNLGGLAGADAKCQTLATGQGLTGTYKAWLSSSTTSAASRLTQSTSPYMLVDRTRIANNWAGLTSGTLLANINKAENGVVTPGGTLTACGQGTPRAQVWTGTNTAGNITTANPINTCSDWTSSAPPAQNGPSTFSCNASGPCAGTGAIASTDAQWTQTCTLGNCQLKAPLYCLEQ